MKLLGKRGNIMDKEIKRILLEDIEEEILEKMPEWFKILRDKYESYKRQSFPMSLEKPKR